MKIDFTLSLIGYDGKALMDGETKGDLTLATVAINSLLSPTAPGASPVLGTQLMEWESLAKRIYSGKKPVELSAYECTQLQERIALAYQHPRVIGPAFDALNGNARKPGKPETAQPADGE